MLKPISFSRYTRRASILKQVVSFSLTPGNYNDFPSIYKYFGKIEKGSSETSSSSLFNTFLLSRQSFIDSIKYP